jgi:hypothetical protein
LVGGEIVGSAFDGLAVRGDGFVGAAGLEVGEAEEGMDAAGGIGFGGGLAEKGDGFLVFTVADEAAGDVENEIFVFDVGEGGLEEFVGGGFGIVFEFVMNSGGEAGIGFDAAEGFGIFLHFDDADIVEGTALGRAVSGKGKARAAAEEQRGDGKKSEVTECERSAGVGAASHHSTAGTTLTFGEKGVNLSKAPSAVG